MSNNYWSGALGGGKREERSVTFVFRHASWQVCDSQFTPDDDPFFSLRSQLNFYLHCLYVLCCSTVLVSTLLLLPQTALASCGQHREIPSLNGTRRQKLLHCVGASMNLNHFFFSFSCRWNISEEEQQACLEANFEGHTDWVNAITLIDEDILVSCSSDKTLRVWKAKGENSSSNSQRSTACLCGHSDYATSLTAARSRPVVASGGLGGEVFLWDLTALAPINAVGGSGGLKVEGIQGSVYSIAGDENCNVVAAGTSDGSIWMIDTRSGAVEATLRGHSSNVRALCLPAEAATPTLLSGSADHTIRAWDLRQRRSFSTLAVHTDSVWALAPGDGAMESVYSGGRDGCVYRTHVASKRSQLVAQEHHPVTALGAMPDCKSLWVATTSSTVKCWKLDSETSEHAFSVGPLPAVRNRMMFGDASHPPLLKSSSIFASIPGVPPVCQVAVLTNRRHVLTQDAEENVLLWDLSKGTSKQYSDKVSLQEAERQRFDPAHNVWPWFQPDTRLGCLAGVLLYPGCFLAETYRRDLGDASAPADAKVNMAQHMLGALFEKWAKKQSSVEETSAVTTVAVAEGDSGGGQQPMSIDALTTIVQPEKIAFEAASPFSLESELSPVVMISGGNGMPPWRCAADSFDGSEREGEIVPQWVADCVLRNNVPIGKDLKMAFVLVPAAKSGLPSLLQSKLNAPRVLGIDKVADYVLRKMAELGIANLAEEPLFWSPEKQAVWEEEQQKAPAMHESSSAPSNVVSKKGSSEASSSGTFGTMGIRQLQPIATTQRQMPATSPLLITCGGAAVPWDFTLAAVKQWMWKRPEDLRLEYGIRVEAGLKPPAIRPP